jgi:Raf kinase inhibitor-like YbhB/YbcL family protein
MRLTSSAFPPNGAIPPEHTRQGADRAPPLAWGEAPAGTASFALIVDDPDAPDPRAPKTVWVHWIIYNVPPNVTALAGKLPPEAREGVNDWKQVGWNGPDPPIGRHRYVFKLYALDTVLPDLGQATKARLEKALAGHVLAQAELVGTYEKGGR